MRTTLTIDEDVAVQIRALRREGGVSLKEVINETLRCGLESRRARKAHRKPYRTPSFDMGPALMPIDNVAEVLSIIEGDDHR